MASRWIPASVASAKGSSSTTAEDPSGGARRWSRPASGPGHRLKSAGGLAPCSRSLARALVASTLGGALSREGILRASLRRWRLGQHELPLERSVPFRQLGSVRRRGERGGPGAGGAIRGRSKLATLTAIAAVPRRSRASPARARTSYSVSRVAAKSGSAAAGSRNSPRAAQLSLRTRGSGCPRAATSGPNARESFILPRSVAAR